MRTLIILAAAIFSVPAITLADVEIRTELSRCAVIVDDAARLQCYDAIAGAGDIQTAEAAAPEVPELPEPPSPVVQATETASRPLDDSVGKQQVEVEEPEGRLAYSATLTRCEESGPSRMTMFYLDNGQVWRQRNVGRRLRLRDCDGDVEIIPDRFGFKLRIPSKKRTVRVARVR